MLQRLHICRGVLFYLAMTLTLLAVRPVTAAGAGGAAAKNLAPYGTVTTSYVSPHETIDGINADFTPANSNDKTRGAYGNWPRNGTQWVELNWSAPINTDAIDVYWFDDQQGVRLPHACRLLAWDGSQWVPVKGTTAEAPSLTANQFNHFEFARVTTHRLRLELVSEGTFSTGILQWKVSDAGDSPAFPPKVRAGVDRDVLLGGQTFLAGQIKGLNTGIQCAWSKAAGPGDVTFSKGNVSDPTASFSAAGDYVLRLTATDHGASATDTLHVKVLPPTTQPCLTAAPLSSWKVDSPLWSNRLKVLICHWIPHCAKTIEDPNLPEGGLENFVNAAAKLAGKPHGENRGAVYCNAWVYNTLESMCLAQMLDPQGDEELETAQRQMRTAIDDWIPKILAAQESDGYLDTYYLLHDRPHWSNKWDHEGYVAGYFIEAAIAHWNMTGGKDTRMYDAAKRLIACWDRNVGPDSGRKWYDGHESIERALVRFAALKEKVEGPGSGRQCVRLAKWLLDNRGGGETYDQSQSPVVQQYEAVGHAVRAVYCYSAMAGVAAETGDVNYLSAVHSLWDNLVNKKYYITGGVGSGETSEGFGKNYSLPNNAYCESCSGCGEIFFQHDLQLAFHDARYAQLYEQTLYNAVLSDIDLSGDHFTYTNSLDTDEARYGWHVCPCCVGNIPRTLLQLPSWMYSVGNNGLYVNLFVGGTVTIPGVGGANVTMVQTTDYPWSGKVQIKVNPDKATAFAMRLRVPDPAVSTLYTSEPEVTGLQSLTVNGVSVPIVMDEGYAVINREWNPGDQIELSIPMMVQRVKCSDQVKADRNRVALRYGPLIYNIESVDENVDSVLAPGSRLATQWRPDLLNGVITVTGRFADGQSLMAIPNFARNNRGGRSLVWIRDQ